jgi:hypothetical protein
MPFMRKYSEYNKSEPLLFHLQISSQKALPDKTLKVAPGIPKFCKTQFELHCLGLKKLQFNNYVS